MSEKGVIFVLGGPGSGKGTQAIAIANEFGLGYASAGDILRAEAKDPNSPNGKQIAEIMNSGHLVPPSLICETIKKTIENSPKKYFLMDGFPRSLEQDEEFCKIMPPCTAVALLDAPDDVLVQRCSKRGQTSGRADDKAECIPERIKVYRAQTQPVLQKYEKEGKVFVVNSNQTIQETKAEFIQKIRNYWQI